MPSDRRSGCELLQHVLGDVEVGEDFVDVVLVVERVEQFEQPLRVVPFDLDRGFRLGVGSLPIRSRRPRPVELRGPR